MHQVVCIGAQWFGGVTFFSKTTMQLLLNLARVLQSGWPMQVQTDGSFDFCDRKLGMIVFGVNSLRGKFRPVSWSLVPNESSDAFSAVYNGAREAFFSVLTPGALRLCPPGQGCELYNRIRDLQASPEVAEVLANPSKTLLVKKAGSDNTTKWHKFVKPC
jgi:hypothetical protein